MATSTTQSEYKDILDSTVGIVFLGTPFKGSPGTKVGQLRVHISRGLNYDASGHLLDVLNCSTGLLDELTNSFAFMARSHQHYLPLVCFYETEPTLLHVKHVVIFAPFLGILMVFALLQTLICALTTLLGWVLASRLTNFVVS